MIQTPTTLRSTSSALVGLMAAAAVPYHLVLSSKWPAYAVQYGLFCSLGSLAYLSWYFLSHLSDQRRPGEEGVLPTLGPANVLTLLRGFGVCLLAGFLFSPRPSGRMAWLPALLYLFAFLSDYLDGYLARRTRHTTRLGAQLDMEVDALGVLIATALAIQYGQLPAWYILTGLAFYLFHLQLYWRRRRGLPVLELPFSMNRRLIGGFQVGFLCVVLWPIFSPPGTLLAGVLFAVPFSLSFGRDWLVASGRLDPAAEGYRIVRAAVQDLLLRKAPVVLRGLVATAALLLLIQAGSGSSAWWKLLADAGATAPSLAAVLLVAWTVMMGLFVAFGAAGRLAALGLLAVSCADLLLAGFAPRNALLLSGSLLLMLMGTGAFSLWQPEELLLGRRAGEHPAA